MDYYKFSSCKCGRVSCCISSGSSLLLQTYVSAVQWVVSSIVWALWISSVYVACLSIVWNVCVILIMYCRNENMKLPIPSDILSMFGSQDEPFDDPALHDGRIRSFAHERGNWASFVYISCMNIILHFLFAIVPVLVLNCCFSENKLCLVI